MSWPTISMAPEVGVVAAVVAGRATWSFQHSLPASAVIALLVGVAVMLFFRCYGRRTP